MIQGGQEGKERQKEEILSLGRNWEPQNKFPCPLEGLGASCTGKTLSRFQLVKDRKSAINR